MQPNDKKNLGYLGEEFQMRLAKIFFSDKDFFTDLIPVIDQNMFTNPQLRKIVGAMKDCYEKYETMPSYQTVASFIREKSRNAVDLECDLATLESLKTLEIDCVDYVKDLSSKFFKQQNIVKIANKILSFAEQGNEDHYEECVDLMQSALNAGNHNDLGTSVFNELGNVLSDDYRVTIPTGIQKLDEALEGGLGKGELGLLMGGSGFGKAQPLDAKIVTPSGWKRMGDIRVGDLVIGRDGKSYPVSGVYPQGIRPIYKVSFSNGTSCECDIEHLWNVNSFYQRRGLKYVLGLSKNCNDKYKSPDYSYKTLTLREILTKGLRKKKGKIINFKIPKVEPVEMETRELPIDPYVFGYFLGDGSYNRMSITVGYQDIDAVRPLLLEAMGDDVSFGFQEDRNLWRLGIKGNHRRKLIEIFHCDSLTSEGKYIPDIYLINSLENRIALLQGIMDSDGRTNKNGSCEFSSKSEQLAKHVQFLVRSLGGYASIDVDSSGYIDKTTCDRVDCGLRYRVTITLCDENIKLFRLQRKQERVKYRTKYKENIFITDAEYIGDKEAQCIMVDSEEHLYLTEDFIVTHNTTYGTAISNFAATYKCEDNGEQGYKVLQIVFEDRVKQIQRKHLSRITGIEARNLSKPEYIEEVRRRLAAYPDKEMLDKNLRIVRFPSGEITANAIKRYVKKLINSGFKPDLMILDYFECLEHEKISNTQAEHEREGKTMRKFESMAAEFDMAVWVFSQGSRESINMDIVTMDKIAGSFKKVQIAHIILSIARTMDDIENNKAVLALLKNRAGESGKVWNGVDYNNGTCTISTDNVDEFGSASAFDKEQNSSMLKDLFKEMKKSR